MKYIHTISINIGIPIQVNIYIIQAIGWKKGLIRGKQNYIVPYAYFKDIM